MLVNSHSNLIVLIKVFRQYAGNRQIHLLFPLGLLQYWTILTGKHGPLVWMMDNKTSISRALFPDQAIASSIDSVIGTPSSIKNSKFSQYRHCSILSSEAFRWCRYWHIINITLALVSTKLKLFHGVIEAWTVSQLIWQALKTKFQKISLEMIWTDLSAIP